MLSRRWFEWVGDVGGDGSLSDARAVEAAARHGPARPIPDRQAVVREDARRRAERAYRRDRGLSDRRCGGSRLSRQTSRNRALFLSRGHAYVYLAYGMSYMLNVSSETVGVGAGVLIRALEPLDGIASMQRNRARSEPARPGARARTSRCCARCRSSSGRHRPLPEGSLAARA